MSNIRSKRVDLTPLLFLATKMGCPLTMRYLLEVTFQAGYEPDHMHCVRMVDGREEVYHLNLDYSFPPQPTFETLVRASWGDACLNDRWGTLDADALTFLRVTADEWHER